MAEAQQFTLEQANGLIPRLTLEFARIARLRDRAAGVARVLAAEVGGTEALTRLLEQKPAPGEREVGQLAELRELAEDVNRTLGRIQDLGCVVKDVELGLVDFHAELEGKRVLLCWQFGETAIAHVHGLDEGFAQRRPLQVPADDEDEDESPTGGQWVN